MVRTAAAALATLLVLTNSAAADAPSMERVDVERASALLAGDTEIVVLDVRAPGEFAAAYIAGATNIDIDADARAESFRTEVAKLDREKPYLVHCAAGIPGGRSERSAAILGELGFEKVYHLEGGINAWKAAGKKFEGTTSDAAPE